MAAGPAQAAITVTNTGDSGAGSLRQAVEDATPGETINLPAGSYTLTGEALMIEKSLTIAGHGSADTSLRNVGNYGLFEIIGPLDATIRDLAISGTTITDKVIQGGVIASFDANLTLQRVVITANTANADGGPGEGGGVVQGGIVEANGGSFKLLESQVVGNIAAASGSSGKGGGVVQGGIFLIAAAITVEGSKIDRNTVAVRGGQGSSNAIQGGGVVQGGVALVQAEGAASSFRASSFSRNAVDASAGPGGSVGGVAQGGVLLLGAAIPTTISEATISTNSVRATGGATTPGRVEGGVAALTAVPGAQLTILGSTIAGNTAESSSPESKGGTLRTVGEIRFGDTVIANGSGPVGSENCAFEDPPVSLGFNLDSHDQCNFHAGGDRVDVNPLLGPLADNGGATETMAPAAGSPAVDQGAAFGLGSDARGVARPIDLPAIPNAAVPGADGSDIGAYELQPTNAFSLGAFKRNKKKGTATIGIALNAPSGGTLVLSGKGLKPQALTVTGLSSTLTMSLVPTGKAKAALNRKKGKRRVNRRKVQLSVTYSPPGNTAATIVRKGTLIKKKRHRHAPAAGTKTGKNRS